MQASGPLLAHSMSVCKLQEGTCSWQVNFKMASFLQVNAAACICANGLAGRVGLDCIPSFTACAGLTGAGYSLNSLCCGLESQKPYFLNDKNLIMHSLSPQCQFTVGTYMFVEWIHLIHFNKDYI